MGVSVGCGCWAGGAGQGGETVGEGVGGATLLPLSTHVPWLVVAMILAPLYRFSLLCERSALWLLHYTHALPLGWLLALASPAGLACRLGWLTGLAWLLACWLLDLAGIRWKDLVGSGIKFQIPICQTDYRSFAPSQTLRSSLEQ